MKSIVNCIVFLIFIKFASCGNPEGEKEHVLDIIGDNDYEVVETDFSDPGVLIFTPTGNGQVYKVMYGDTTLWTKTRRKILEKVMAFKSNREIQFIHIFYKVGKKHRGKVIAKAGQNWKTTGNYDIEKEGEGDGSTLNVKNLFSKFTKKLKRKSESEAEEESEREAEVEEFELSGDPSEIMKVKKYISVGIPTIVYRPYFGKRISKVTDKFQTVWSQDKKHRLTNIYAFNKLGFNRLLYIDTGNKPYEKGSFFENFQDEWRSMSRDAFMYKIRLRCFNQVDPQFDVMPSMSFEDVQERSRYRRSSDSSSGSSTPARRHSPLRRAVRRRYDYESVPDQEEEEERRSPIEETKASIVTPPSNEGSYMNYPIQEKTPSEGEKSQKDDLSLEFPIKEGDLSISWPYQGGKVEEEKKEEKERESEGSEKSITEPLYGKVVPRKERGYQSMSEPQEESYRSESKPEGSSLGSLTRMMKDLRLDERSLPLTSGSLTKSDELLHKEGLESYSSPEEGSENGSVKFTEGYKKLFLPSTSDESSIGDSKEVLQEGDMGPPDFDQPSSLRSDLGISQSDESLRRGEPIYINIGGPRSHHSDQSSMNKRKKPSFGFKSI